MKPAPFTYHRPQTLDEALVLLGDLGGEAKPLAGGQSLGPMLNMRLARPAHAIDLNDLLELDYLRDDGAALEIGGLTRHHRLATAPEVARMCPLLSAAAATIGHYAIRQRGTIGGSLVHADPAAQLPLVAVALDAEVTLASRDGRRTVLVEDFLQSIMTVDLRPGELLAAVRLPHRPPGTGWGFDLFSRRRGDFAMVAVAALVEIDAGGAVRAISLVIGGVGPVPQRLRAVEAAAVGSRADAAWAARTAEAAARAVEPEDAVPVPAEYRRDLVRSLTARALTAAAAQAVAGSEEGARQ